MSQITTVKNPTLLAVAHTNLCALQTLPLATQPYSDLPPIIGQLLEGKAQKGLTFDQIAKEIGRDEVWLAAAFYGQVRRPRLAYMRTC